MTMYEVVIDETVTYRFKVEAMNPGAAQRKAKAAYYDDGATKAEAQVAVMKADVVDVEEVKS